MYMVCQMSVYVMIACLYTKVWRTFVHVRERLRLALRDHVLEHGVVRRCDELPGRFVVAEIIVGDLCLM